MKPKLQAVLAASSAAAMVLHLQAFAAPQKGASGIQTLSQLRADKTASLARRDPRAAELLEKAETRLRALRESSPDDARLARLEATIEQIAMTASGVAESRLKADIELLQAVVSAEPEPAPAELAPLQERYARLCQQLDDLLLVKDLDRCLQIHDRFVRYTSLGLWSREKIASQLERMEDLAAAAPDIAYGRSELIAGFRARRLAAVPKLVYLGSFPEEEIYLTPDRRSLILVEEGTGGSIRLETADHVVQDSNGNFIDVTAANNPRRGVPFSPPLSVWAKSRILDGRIPAISFRLVDKSGGAASSRAPFLTPQDVLDGKLDDYMRRNSGALGSSRTAVLIGFLTAFDRDAAATSFGSDGKTPFYFLLDPKLQEMAPDRLEAELSRRLERGAFTALKTLPEALCNQYGDPSVPDGPERVRDAWKRVRGIVTAGGGDTVAFYSTAGGFHGNKNAAKLGRPDAGNEAWNKLEYYWPGEGVLDWIGIDAAGSNPDTDAKGPNLLQAIEPFMSGVADSPWRNTPVMLRGLSLAKPNNPLEETSWIGTIFDRIIPLTFPNISIAFLRVPESPSLWSREAVSAYRTKVSSNKFYKWPLRFKMLEQTAKDESPPG